ncbi:MAG: hypothetical protein ACLVLH_16215 [Eisenbergiella massiliensis]
MAGNLVEECEGEGKTHKLRRWAGWDWREGRVGGVIFEEERMKI